MCSVAFKLETLSMNLCLFLTFYLGFHSFVFSLHCAEGGEHLNVAVVSATAVMPLPPPQKLMGIEIETSAIKIESPDPDHKIGFTIELSPGKMWMMEEDTSDDTFSSDLSYAGYDRNLELKTVGGFNQVDIYHVINPMKDLLSFFHASARPSLQITAPMLSSLLGTTVTAELTNLPEVSIKAKEDDTSVRPQITYQLPLHLVPQVFERLKFLGHEKVNDFLDCLDPTVPLTFDETKINEKLLHRKLMMRNAARNQKLQLFFKRDIAETIQNITHGASPNVKGFCYLFLYYWYVIFNNKENQAEESEPGPKKSLAIISRVPVSQIFDKLSSQEKLEVQTILGPIITVHGSAFRIKAYSNYDGQTITSPATILNWYGSIINLAERIEGVDLLSPPPGLEEGYSMGALDIDTDSSGFPLIEVRGYAKIPLDTGLGLPVISNLHQLVQIEAVWFFNIH